MIEVLRFIFTDFWHWLGVAIMIFIITRWTPFQVYVVKGEDDVDNQ